MTSAPVKATFEHGAPALRPRSGAEIVDAAFQLVRRNYLTYIVLGLIPYVLIVPMETFFPELYGEDATFVATLAYIGIYTILGAIPGAAMMVLAAASLLGQPLSAAGALRRSAAHGAAVIFSSLLVTAAFLVGLVLLVVPGVMVMISYFAIPGVVVLERLDVRSALRRSRELARGERWRIFLCYVLPTLVYYVVSGLLEAGMEDLLQHPPAARAIAILFGVLTSPVIAAIAVTLYYDLRIRKEAFDLEVLGARLDAAAGSDEPPMVRKT